MQDMPMVSVRLSEKEKRELLQYGGLSKGIREGVALYLKAQKSREIFRKLEELQKKNLIKTALGKKAELIREDRTR
jgi:hypothetical protein